MRIILFVDTFPSLSETFISNKVKHLSDAGMHVTILCVRYDAGLFQKLFADHHNVRVVFYNKSKLILFLLLHPWAIVRAFFRTRNPKQRLFKRFRIYFIKKQKPDILHFEFSGIGVDYLYEIKHLKCKKVVSCRGSAEKVKLLIHEDRKAAFSQLLTEVDAVHCVSEDMKQTILPYCGNPGKIFINYPSIDATFFSRQHAKEIDNEVVTLLTVGRFTFQKGFGTGLRAINKLRESGIPFKWLIVGNGPEYEEIVYQVNHFRLQDYVVLLGSKSADAVKSLMEQADIYFLPSVYEGIANVALEAMSMRLPIVATRSGGMEEVITHDENGLLADVYDHTALAAQLWSLLRDKALRQKLGSAARNTIITRFELSIQTKKYLEIYAGLLNVADALVAAKQSVIAPHHIKIVPAKPAKQKLHIGIILPEFPTISETFFINKVIGLCKRGHRVTVFGGTRPSDPLAGELYKLDQYKNLHITHLDFKATIIKYLFIFPSAFIRSFHLNPQLFRRDLYINLCKAYINKFHCDIYHFGYSGTALFYLQLFESLNGKTMISCRGTAENVKLVTEKERVKNLKILFKIVDKIHCVSSNMCDTIQQYGAPPEKIFINRPAIDTNFFSRSTPYTAQKTITIFSIGRLVFQKGFLVGVLAVHALKEQFKNFIWNIAGDGPEMEELTSHIHSLGLTKHVQLLGKKNRDETKALYEEADIYFLPSVSEGLANAVLEAMSMQLPVVSSDVGGMQEAITHNVDGKLCHNYNHLEMTKQLLELCNDFPLRKKLGETARKTAEARFNIGRYIDVFEENYYSILL